MTTPQTYPDLPNVTAHDLKALLEGEPDTALKNAVTRLADEVAKPQAALAAFTSSIE